MRSAWRRWPTPTTPADAPSDRRPGDRLRARRRVLHHRDRRVRQTDAAGVAVDRVRRRNGCRFVRAVPVLSARGRSHRSLRLAGDAAHFRRRRAAHHAAVARARRATASRRGLGADRRAAAIGGAGAHRGVRTHAATCCSCSASSPAASRSSSSPCICRPIWSTAACRPRSAAGRSPPSACSTSSAPSAPAGSPT